VTQRDRYKWSVRGTKKIIFEAIEEDRQTDRYDKRNREDSFVFEREKILK
jgi:hypothetical protein